MTAPDIDTIARRMDWTTWRGLLDPDADDNARMDARMFRVLAPDPRQPQQVFLRTDLGDALVAHLHTLHERLAQAGSGIVLSLVPGETRDPGGDAAKLGLVGADGNMTSLGRAVVWLMERGDGT